MTLNELKDILEKLNVCYYHYSKYISSQVDLLLVPYDYILNKITRKTMGITVKNNVIIFDEAHNIYTKS